MILPEPSTALVPLSKRPTGRSTAEIKKRMAEIDMANTQSIIEFGSAAQAELQVISQEMLQGVRNKDVGPAGDSLRDIVTTIRGFSVSELDVRRKRTLVGQAARPRRAGGEVHGPLRDRAGPDRQDHRQPAAATSTRC